MIDCVSLANCGDFGDNLLVAQHRLRYKEIIEKERWNNIYALQDMEFDRYDNLATEYFVARNISGHVVGVTRSYPTTLPYMLSEKFSYLFSSNLPSSPKIMEASRLVVDRSILSKSEREPIINELIVAYMERGLQRGIDAYVGFMLPKIWNSTFIRAGWDVKWVGPELALSESGEVVRAGLMFVSEEMNNKIRSVTDVHGSVLNFGCKNNQSYGSAMLTDFRNNELQRDAA